MMRFFSPFFVIVTAFCLIAVWSVSAQAQSSRLYFAGYMGLNTMSDRDFSESTQRRSGDITFKNTLSFAGAMGLRLTPQWRLEGEISYRKANISRLNLSPEGGLRAGGELGTWLYMMNLYYDFDYEWRNFQPYLTGGLGLASQRARISGNTGPLPNAKEDSWGLAYALGGGLRYRFNPDMALSTGYRFVGTTDLDIGSYDLKYRSHEFRLGLEVDLPSGWLK